MRVFVFLGLALFLASCFASSQAHGKEAFAKDAGDYLSARVAGARGDLEIAIAFLNKIRKRHPDSPDLLERLLPLKVSAGYVASAIPDAKRLVEKNPRDQFAQLILTIGLIKEKNYAAALAKLSRKGSALSSWPAAPLLAAWAHYGAGETEAAHKILKTRPLPRPLPFMHRAMLHDLEGESEEAEALFRQTGRNGAQDRPRAFPRFSLIRANFLERLGAKDEARQIYKTLAARESLAAAAARARLTREGRKTPPPLIRSSAEGAAEGLFHLALLARRMGAARDAIFYSRMSLYLRPRFESAWMLMGAQLHLEKRFQDAIGFYEKIPSSSPFAAAAAIAIAQAREAMGETKEAVALLKNLARRKADNVEIAAALGDIYIARRDFQNAGRAYSRAIALDAKRAAKESASGEKSPRRWQLFFSRGMSYERRDLWKDAERDLKRARRLSKDDPFVLNYLAYSWADRNRNLRQALAMLQSAVEKKPNNGFIIDSLGWAYYRLGNYDEALRYLERAVKIEPAETEINDHLGDVLWHMGRRIEARFQWQRALEVSDGNKDVTKKRLAEIRDKIAFGLKRSPKRGAGL